MPPAKKKGAKQAQNGTANKSANSGAAAKDINKPVMPKPDPALVKEQQPKEEIKEEVTNNNAASEKPMESPTKSGSQSQRHSVNSSSKYHHSCIKQTSSPNENANVKVKPGQPEIRMGNIAEERKTLSPATDQKAGKGYIKSKKDPQALNVDEPKEQESLDPNNSIIMPNPCEKEENDADAQQMNESIKMNNLQDESLPSSKQNDKDALQSSQVLQSHDDNKGRNIEGVNDKNEELKVSHNEFSSLSAQETRSYERNQEEEDKLIPTKLAIVRKPSPRLTEGIVSHIERNPVDFAKALKQWNNYMKVLQENGWDVIEAPPADECPDGVFIEDVIVMYRGTALITNPGSDVRKKELAGIEQFLTNILGCPIKKIIEPGTLDGGDILKVGKTIFVGKSARTNEEGIRQLAQVFEPLGAKIVPIPLTKVLHLKSAVTALPNGTIIGWDQAVDDQKAFGLPYLTAKEESGAHVVILNDSRLMISEFASQSMKLYREQLPGIKFGTINIQEFEKLEGCVTCLSVRVRELPENSRFFQLFPQKPSSTPKSNTGKDTIVPGIHYKFEDLLKLYVKPELSSKQSENTDLIKSQPPFQDPKKDSTVQESALEEESKDSPKEVPSQSNKILPQTSPQADANIEIEEDVKQPEETQNVVKKASEEIDQSAKQESPLQEVEENKEAPQEEYDIIQNQAESNFGGNSNQEQQSTITSDPLPKTQIQEDQPQKDSMEQSPQPNSSLETSKAQQPDPSLAQAEFVEEQKENSEALKSPQKKLELNTSDLEMKMQKATSLEGSLLQNFEGGKGSTDPLKSEDRKQVSSENQLQEDEVLQQEDEHPQKTISEINIENDEENKEDDQNQEASSVHNGESDPIKTDNESNGAKISQVEAISDEGERDAEDLNGQGEDSNQDAKINQQSQIQDLPQQNQNQNNMEAESAENPQHHENPAASASENSRMPQTNEQKQQAQVSQNLDEQNEEEKKAEDSGTEANNKDEASNEEQVEEEEKQDVHKPKPMEELAKPKETGEKTETSEVAKPDILQVKPDEQQNSDESDNQAQNHEIEAQIQPKAENPQGRQELEEEKSSLQEESNSEAKDVTNPQVTKNEEGNSGTQVAETQPSSLPQKTLPTSSDASNESPEEESKENLTETTTDKQATSASPSTETPAAVEHPVSHTPMETVSIKKQSPHREQIEHSLSHDHEENSENQDNASDQGGQEAANFLEYLMGDQEVSMIKKQNEMDEQKQQQTEQPFSTTTTNDQLQSQIARVETQSQKPGKDIDAQKKNKGDKEQNNDDYGIEDFSEDKRKGMPVQNADNMEKVGDLKSKELEVQTSIIEQQIMLPDLGPELNEKQKELLKKFDIPEVSKDVKPNEQTGLLLSKINDYVEKNQELGQNYEQLQKQAQDQEQKLIQFQAQTKADFDSLVTNAATIRDKVKVIKTQYSELNANFKNAHKQMHEDMKAIELELAHKVSHMAHKQVTDAKIKLLETKKARSDLILQKLKVVSLTLQEFKKYKEESKDYLEKMFTQTKQEMVQEFNLKTTIFQKFDLRHIQQTKQIKELTSSRNQLQAQLSQTSSTLEKQKIDNTQLSKQLTDRKKQFEEKCQAYEHLNREFEAYKRDHLAEKENLLSQRTRVEARENETQNKLQLLQADSYRLSLEKSDFDKLKNQQDQHHMSEEQKLREREKDILRRSMELDIRGRSQNTEIGQLRQKLARSQQETLAAKRELDTIQQQYQQLNSQIAGFQSKLGNMSMEKSTAESQYKQMKFYFQVLFYLIAFLILSQIFFSSRK